MAATDPIRNRQQVRRMARYWLRRGSARNCAMIVVGVCTGLRISDLLGLRWSDVYDLGRGRPRTHVHVKEKKTGKRRTIALNRRAAAALRLCWAGRRGDFVFASGRDPGRAIGRVQAWRIVRAAAEAVAAAGRIGCHSLRKTFGYLAWRMGAAQVLLTDIFNHSSFEVTRRYLGITQEERDAVYLGLELW